MGNSFGKKEKKIVLVGLNGSGKTSLLYQITMGEMIATIPTLSPNVEKVGEEMVVWDMGGHKNIRGLWEEHYAGAVLIVFVVDATNPSRLQEAASVFSQITSHPSLPPDTPLLILANKQDKENALSCEEIKHFLFLGGQDPFWGGMGGELEEGLEEREREGMDGRKPDRRRREYEKRREKERRECERRHHRQIGSGEMERRGRTDNLDLPGWDLDKEEDEKVARRVTTSEIRHKREKEIMQVRTPVGRRVTTSEVNEKRRRERLEQRRQGHKSERSLRICVSPPKKQMSKDRNLIIEHIPSEEERKKELIDRVTVLPSSACSSEGMAPAREWMVEVVADATTPSPPTPSSHHHFHQLTLTLSHD